METKCDIKKVYTPRKADKGHSHMLKYNGFSQAKTAETVPQNPTHTKPAVVAVFIQQAATTVTYTQPITIPATAPTQPVVTISGQLQQVPKFCALCTPMGRQCPSNYLLPIHPKWSDPEEEEKHLNKQK